MVNLLPLHQLLRADARPAQAPVCHDGQRWIDWATFMGRIQARHALFSTHPASRWLMTEADPLAFLVDLLALLAAGKHAVVPPNTLTGTVERLRHAWDAVTPPHATDDPVAATREALPTIVADAPHIHLYTSGSTGEPKAVVKALRHFETEIAVLEGVWGRELGALPVVSTAPHQHFYGLLFRLLWPLAAGRVFDTVTCAEPETLSQRLRFLGRAVLVSSPAQLSRLPELMDPRALAPTLQRVFSSGGPLPATAAQALAQHWGRPPTEVFGSTETGGIAWRERREDDAWTPFPGVQVSAGSDNALQLRSALVDGDAPYPMDDAVQLLPDGRFRLLGRLDRVVKIEEKRVSLPDMEDRLRAHEWVGDVAAVGLTRRRQTVGVAIVLSAAGRLRLENAGRSELARALRQHLAVHFDAVVLPRQWRFVPGLPLNERGKLTEAALQALFNDEPPRHAPA